MSCDEEAVEGGAYILSWHTENRKFRAQRGYAEVEYLPDVVSFQSETCAEARVERAQAGDRADKTGRCLLVGCGQSAGAQADLILLCQCKRRKGKQEDDKARGLPVHEIFLQISTRDTAPMVERPKRDFLRFFCCIFKKENLGGAGVRFGW